MWHCKIRGFAPAATSITPSPHTHDEGTLRPDPAGRPGFIRPRRHAGARRETRSGQGPDDLDAGLRRLPHADGSRGSPANPIIAGQHPEYLVKQLTEFKSGKRNNPIMKGFATPSRRRHEERRRVLCQQGRQARLREEQGHGKLGEKIYRAGIADKAVPPAPAATARTGRHPGQYPRIGGQHADYTEAQLVAFRGGARGNSPQMGVIAERMSDREVKAVADYIAGLH
jgi:cytochrome c553